MGSTRTLCKDFFKFQRDIKSISDGQARIFELDDDNFEVFTLEITPRDGHYKGGKFQFKVNASNCNWPNEPPTVICLTDIYHPNIDTEFDYEVDNSSNVCVNLLGVDWCKDCNFDDCLQAILFLFYEPNFSDPLSPLCCSDADFEENVRISLEGGDIEGRIYETNYGWAENKNAVDAVNAERAEPNSERCPTVDKEGSTENKLGNNDTNASTNIEDSEQKNGVCSTADMEGSLEKPDEESTERQDVNVDSNEEIFKKECNSTVDQQISTNTCKAINDSRESSDNNKITDVDNTEPTTDKEYSTDNSTFCVDLSISVSIDEECNDEKVESNNRTPVNVYEESTNSSTFSFTSTGLKTSYAQEITLENDIEILAEDDLSPSRNTSVEKLDLKVNTNDNDLFRFTNLKTRRFRFLAPGNANVTMRFKTFFSRIKELITSGT